MAKNFEIIKNEEINTYFKEAEVLLDDYKWVYNFPVTHFLTPSVLNSIPNLWKGILNSMTTDDLNSICIGKSEEHWPEILKKFCDDCQRLRFASFIEEEKDESKNHGTTKKLSNFKSSGIKLKKMMEISNLTSHIHKECKDMKVTHIVDMGSGMGYLDNALHIEHGYRVLGLETQETIVHKAQKKFEELCPSSNSVRYKHFHVEADLLNGAIEHVEKWLEECRDLSQKCIHEEERERSPVIALVGLHTCGDLAASTIRLFVQSADIFSVLVVTPCCFHKMTHSQDCDTKFKNFPLSSSLKSIIRDLNNFDTPFLRLASQCSSLGLSQQSKEEHEQHSKHVLARAVLQLYAVNHNLDIQKTKRKAITNSRLNVSGVEMVKHMMSRYQLTPNCDSDSSISENDDKYEKDIINMFEEYSYLCPLIEGVSALQAALQGVAERFVLVDMQASLMEHGGTTLRCRLTPLWDETRSPRARAIFASRLS